jgi:hypothetical protein
MVEGMQKAIVGNAQVRGRINNRTLLCMVFNGLDELCKRFRDGVREGFVCRELRRSFV